MKKFKKTIYIGIGSLTIGIFLFILIISVIITTVSGTDDPCKPSSSLSISVSSSSSNYASIEEFVKEHEEAYLLSWKVGGFLPSASIVQTMIENGFNFTNPNGTSFWKAHNMGGVKTNHISDFEETINIFGEDSVDLSGTKPGTNVGDGTGGDYVWFKDYNVGIVGKAEFMKNQSLYSKAINNTDGISTLEAIAAGGWASDPVDYISKLSAEYERLGRQFQWLDDKAISEYGTSPVNNSPSASSASQSVEYSSPSNTVPEASSIDTDSWELIVVNRDNMKTDNNFTDVDFVPVYSNNNRTDITVDSRIKDATEKFLKKAISDINPNFQIVSGYRSHALQGRIFNEYIHQEMTQRGISAEEATDIVQTYSQPAGASEHMTGLAIDITHTGEFNTMSEEIKLKLEEIGVEFGFIRHFKEKYKEYTGISEEDWHFRYVGVEHAKKMFEQDISLEEYVEKYGRELNSNNASSNKNCKSSSRTSSTYGGAVDGTGRAPEGGIGYSTGYLPNQLPDELKEYIIDPAAYGIEYGGPNGWMEKSGQCVDLTLTLARGIWGTGHLYGHGKDQAGAFAALWNVSLTTKPVKGAIWSSFEGGVTYGHTGIVSHVFEDGTILIVEQNFSQTGAYNGFPNAWEYRLVTTDYQERLGYVFAYPNGQEPILK